MDNSTRQGLGLALLGAAAWGMAAVLSLLTDGARVPVIAGAAIALVAVVGVVALLVGLVVAGVSLLRARR